MPAAGALDGARGASLLEGLEAAGVVAGGSGRAFTGCAFPPAENVIATGETNAHDGHMW